MNWNEMQGQWSQLKGRIQMQWGKLTDDDVDVIAGKREQLIGKLQEKYGYQRSRAEREADKFVENCPIH